VLTSFRSRAGSGMVSKVRSSSKTWCGSAEVRGGSDGMVVSCHATAWSGHGHGGPGQGLQGLGLVPREVVVF
jgi:hypothetical protein